MRVLLINPPVRDFYNTPQRRQPLGLLYLAGALKAGGHEVSLIDAGASRRVKRVNPGDEVKSITHAADGDDSSPFKLFGRFYHFGPGFEEVTEKIRRFDPQVVGISSLFNAYGAEALACAKAAREAAPGAAVVLGGGYPSSRPGAALDHHAVDFTVSGEGEAAFAELVDRLDRGGDPHSVPGVSSRDGLMPPTIADRIDDLPYPARELLDLDAYGGMALILSSRGCPFRCSFCSAHLTSGRTFRPRSPEKVVDEMLDCFDQYGVEAFDFEDDNLTVDPRRAMELMERIIEVFGEQRIRLHAMNGISMKGLTPSLLSAMRRAGFRNINLSPLSLNPDARCAMARPEELDEALTLPEKAVEAGLKVTAYMMIGFPGQRLTEIMAEIDNGSRKPVLLAPSVFYPAPGSTIQHELFSHLDEAGPREWGLTRSSLFPEVPGGLTRRELRTAFWMTRLANFARSVEGGFEARIVHSIPTGRPLDAEERGLAAAAEYLRTGKPQGIRLRRKGEYEVFALDEMIDDPAFYARYGIPGLGQGIMEKLRKRV